MEGQEMSKDENSELIAKGEALHQRTGLGLYLVYNKEKAIGYCGFMETHPPSEDVDVFYAFAKSHTSNGYATEVCAALANCFRASNFKGQLTAVVHPKNGASIKVLEKNHFQSEGYAPGDLSHLLKYRWVSEGETFGSI